VGIFVEIEASQQIYTCTIVNQRIWFIVAQIYRFR